MAEIVIPPIIVPDEESVELVDDGTAVFKPAMAAGITQRQQMSPPRWRVTQRWKGLRDADLARMMGIAHALRGRFNTLRAFVGNAPRGTMPATEVVVNGNFDNGTTSWSVASEGALSVNDQTLRVTRAATVSGTNAFATASILTVVQYAPYLWRIAVAAVKGNANPAPTHGSDAWRLVSDDWDDGTEVSLREAALQPKTTSLSTYADNVNPVSLGQTAAGDYYDLSWATMARCLLVDNGVNSLPYSDQINNAAWTKSGCTVSANSTADPFGASTADQMIEDSGGTYHYVTQSTSRASADASMAVWGFFKATTSDRHVTLWIGADGGSNGSFATFNIVSGAGAGAVTNNGTATDGRTVFYNAGNGWYYCAVITRAPASASIQCVAYMHDTTNYTYSGNGTSALGISRLGCGLTAFPPYAPETVAAARATGEAQTGSTLRVKGGPVSSSGLLLAGDFIEVNGELKRITSAFDTDGAGRGTLHFEPELFASPADNTPVVIHKPMGRFILAEPPRWSNRFGRYADLELTFESVYEP